MAYFKSNEQEDGYHQEEDAEANTHSSVGLLATFGDLACRFFLCFLSLHWLFRLAFSLIFRLGDGLFNHWSRLYS